MDPEISSWVIEWLLRNHAPDSLVEESLRILPISNCGSRIQKLIRLRIIQTDVSQGLITETILDNLEMIQELNRTEGDSITQKMKDAYCAVAVECTLKFMAASPQSDPEYVKAIERIWRDRIGKMESSDNHLFSDELNEWKNKIELSLHDVQMRKRLCKLPKGTKALKKVRAYLEEAFGLIGPSFLETVKVASGKSELDKVPGSVSEAEPVNTNEGRPDSQELGRDGSPTQEVTEEALVQKVDPMEDSSITRGFVSVVKPVNKDERRLDSQELGSDGSPREEETGSLPETRLHLPSPKRSKISPLKKYEDKKFTARRAVKKWSVLEELTLRAGVQKFGEGYWKTILRCHPDVFKDRNEVDLKDKWRNIKRYGRETI